MPYNSGSRKALGAMRKRYGFKRGTSIFFARANRLYRGRKTRPHVKANVVYRKRRKRR